VTLSLHMESAILEEILDVLVKLLFVTSVFIILSILLDDLSTIKHVVGTFGSLMFDARRYRPRDSC